MISESLVTELRAFGPVREREPLSRHTTVGIGGPADLYAKVETVDALVRILDAADRHATPWFILGAGSNLLVGDGGIRGIVIEFDAKQIAGPVPQPDGKARFTIEAGASLAYVARRLARLGFAGLEWAVGIPGTLGGAVVTNAGAYGGCLSDVLVSVQLVDPGGLPRDLPAAAFQLSYRESVFTRGLIKQVAVLSVTVELTPDDPTQVIERMNRLDADRKAAQPTGQNTGSVFKNPPGDSAWRLIDAAGLRGHRIGGAEITRKHCNFFANTGGATAADMNALIRLAQRRVHDQFGVELEPEVWFTGEGFASEPEVLIPGPSPNPGRGAPQRHEDASISPAPAAPIDKLGSSVHLGSPLPFLGEGPGVRAVPPGEGDRRL
jgi:UDP-N-acetylmuramate dehydrogenase